MEAWSDDDFSQDTILVTPQKKNRAQSNSQSSKSDREIPTISSKEWESPSDVTKEAVTLSKEKDANQKNQETFNSLMEEEISIQSHQVSLNQEISCPLCKQNLLKFTLQERETHVNECLDSCFTPPTSPTQSHTNSNCQEVGASLTRVELTPNNESLKVEKSNITPKHEQVTLWKQLLDGNSRKSTNGESTGKRISNADAKAQDKKPRVENEGGKASKTRSCPFYKKLPDTSFTMDAFCYGKIENCTGYFLSHYHSDHYRGITKGFNHGPIYCSSVTGNLLRLHIGVPDNMIVRLPFNQESSCSN
ncbi:DNA cross-link repair protein PSO2/SNM1 [Basidiobolus ranarum]|uniref:DNA cross-link repair protein PSO2/SNM1 n=1 Tax=Basidiobolus ranarum TaxID=34480 RepID=A0ABR2WJB6_9FUNG